MNAYEKRLDRALDLLRDPEFRVGLPIHTLEIDLQDPSNDPVDASAMKAAGLLEIDFDQDFLIQYRRVLTSYTDALRADYVDPNDFKSLAARLRLAAENPLSALDDYVHLKPTSRSDLNYRFDLSTIMRESCAVMQLEGGFVQDILRYLRDVERRLHDRADHYEEQSKRPGPRRNHQFWMLIREAFVLAEGRRVKLSLPSNENATDEDKYTPLMKYVCWSLEVSTDFARSYYVGKNDIDPGIRSIVITAIDQDACTPRGTILRRLRAYKRLRQGP